MSWPLLGFRRPNTPTRTSSCCTTRCEEDIPTRRSAVNPIISFPLPPSAKLTFFSLLGAIVDPDAGAFGDAQAARPFRDTRAQQEHAHPLPRQGNILLLYRKSKYLYNYRLSPPHTYDSIIAVVVVVSQFVTTGLHTQFIAMDTDRSGEVSFQEFCR